MPVLQFTNPVDLPCYVGWDFRVEPSAIRVRVEDVRDLYARYLENHDSRIPKHWPAYQEAIDIAEKHRELADACAQGRDVIAESARYLWAFVNDLMFTRRFLDVGCPGCARTFAPEECEVKEWAFGGGGLGVSGGRRVVCSGGHTLYACGEWRS